MNVLNKMKSFVWNWNEDNANNYVNNFFACNKRKYSSIKYWRRFFNRILWLF